MRASSFLVLAIIVATTPAASQDTTATAKIDTMLIYQRAMMEMQKKMYEEVRYDEPLADKWAGIELNLARLLVSSGDDYFTLSGTFSLFNVSRSAELAFPFFYQKGTKTVNESFSNQSYDVPLTLLNFDVSYRYFIGKHQDGFYFSAGTRYTYIKGIEGTDFVIFNINTGGQQATASKLGAYFGLGYRYFTRSGFYWGVSLIYGRYLGGGDRDFQEVLLDDMKTIIDIELLKIGFAF